MLGPNGQGDPLRAVRRAQAEGGSTYLRLP